MVISKTWFSTPFATPIHRAYIVNVVIYLRVLLEGPDRVGGPEGAARGRQGDLAPAPARHSRSRDCCSPKPPRPFVLHSHHRGEFQSALSVGTKTTLSWTGGSSEALQRQPGPGKPVQTWFNQRGSEKDGTTAMGVRPWGFRFLGVETEGQGRVRVTCQGHSKGEQGQGWKPIFRGHTSPGLLLACLPTRDRGVDSWPAALGCQPGLAQRALALSKHVTE